MQALHEVHKILGQVDILGSPIVLGSSIFAGLTTFFKEPAKARNPKQFARGIGKGSLALVKFSAFGFLEAGGQVRGAASLPSLCRLIRLVPRTKFKLAGLQLAGGVSKGLALMTMDQEFVNRFRIRSVTVRQRLLQGVQAAAVGVYEGVLGKLTKDVPPLTLCLSALRHNSELYVGSEETITNIHTLRRCFEGTHQRLGRRRNARSSSRRVLGRLRPHPEARQRPP